MTNRNIAFAGAALLLLGLFAPIVTMPIIGTINLFGNGGNPTALALLVLSIVGAALAAKDRKADVLWVGAAACGIVIYSFGRLQYGMAQMRESLSELADNPFGGLAAGALQTVQIQWGWVVLAAGAGLLLYAGFKGSGGRVSIPNPLDNIGRAVLAVSAVCVLVSPALDLWGMTRAPSSSEAKAALPTTVASASEEVGPTAEERAYITQNLSLYDVSARYFDSMLDGRVPGVDFKIKNNGTRTLNSVKVRVVFLDDAGRPIAEETYFPVLVSSYSFGNSNTPLRPNYIWQQERGQFYTAKNVPTEWKTGSVTASITEIEFRANE